jgi:hypothetical protein
MSDVIQPGIEVSLRWEGILLPKWWHFVQEDALHQVLHITGHGKLSLKGKGDVSEVLEHQLNEHIHVANLLEEGVLEGSSRLLTNSADDFVIRNKGKGVFVVDSAHEFLHLLLDGVATVTASSSRLRRDFLKGGEQDCALEGQEINLSIRVETIGVGCFWGSFLDVLKVSLVGLTNWALEHFSVDIREELNIVEKVVLHDTVEIG